MNLVQQSFNRMKTLARESDLPKKLLFDVINQVVCNVKNRF